MTIPPAYRNDLPSQSGLWNNTYLVFLEGITAIFDGFKALDIEAFAVRHNELRVVIGPNGAGKTTLCDVVSGKTRPASGRVHFDGDDITDFDEARIARRGVGRKFQTPTVYDSLTTYQNMELALPGRRNLWSNLFASTNSTEADHIMALLKRARLDGVVHTEARFLSHGQRQWLAIAALVLSGPKLLMVDEPAAGLTDSETAMTADLLLELKELHTLIVIEHDMDFVRRLGSQVTVLNEGRIMAEGSLQELQSNPEVIDAYLGR